MTYLKIIALTFIFFILGYMVSFVDYIIRLFSSDSIIYTSLLFLIFSFLLAFILKTVVYKFIDFNIRSPKLLFSALMCFIGLNQFYNEFYHYVIEHPFIIILFLLVVVVASYIYVTIIVKSSRTEKYVFLAYFIFVIGFNFIFKLLNYDYDFMFLEWSLVALKSLLYLMTFYFTAKFLVTSKSYELMLSCYSVIFLIFAAQSLFAIILYFS